MPANLTPQYLAAERRFKEAKTPDEKLDALREMLAVIPKHKGTEKLQADIKRRISRMQDESRKSQRRGRKPPAWIVEPEGAGQVAVVGLPNSGKSSLVAAFTEASPVVAEYPFTTQLPQPAMAQFEDVQIQLVDCPPLHPGHTSHWHADILRHADAWLAVLDLSGPDTVGQLRSCEGEILRLLTPKSAEAPESFRWDLKRTLFVGAKADAPGALEKAAALREALPDVTGAREVSGSEALARGGTQAARTSRGEAGARDGNASGGSLLYMVSSKEQTGLEGLPGALFGLLEVIRVYSKAPGKKPDMSRPYVLPSGSTVMNVAAAVHRDIAEGLRYAKVWGSAKYDGQAVQKDYILSDGDIIEIHA